MDIIEVTLVLRIRVPDSTTRPLFVAVTGTGAARAARGALDVSFRLSPPPTADEDVWLLLARIASEGARAQAKEFG
jgi:hypothetical protein